MKLTESAIAKLALDAGGKKSGKKELITFDDDLPGFGIRLRAGGSRTWVYQYKLGPKHRRITFGKYPALRPAKARDTAEKLHAEVKLGNDPAGAKAEKQTRAAETFGAIVKDYLARRRGQVRSSTYGENERHLDRNLRPLHGLHITKLDKRAIATELARLSEEAGPTQANRTRASLSKFLNWCVAEGLAEINTAAFTNKNPEQARDRVLTDDELRTVWNALPDGDYGAIVKLLILSGQRANEIALLRWSEIDLKRGTITLPRHRTKNRREHVIPLSPPMRDILEAQEQRDGRDLVFGVGEGGFSGWSRAKARLDEVATITPWIIHDIRRSVATGMAAIGIQPHIIEAVLNHISGHKAGVAGIYNRNTYEAEKALALSRWAEHAMAVVEGKKSKVASLKRA
jgi:integrase